MRNRWSKLAAALGGFVLVATAAPGRATACGGFFCDNPGAGQPPMPVDQSGETIVFVMDGTSVEAHIQIQYTGDPERFAWLIPLQAEPEVTVGSARLFANLLNSTVPSVTVNNTFDLCDDSGRRRGSFGCGFGGSSDDESAGSFRAGGGDGSSGPRSEPPVDADRTVVGAFEVTILRGSSADIERWLVDNGYLPDDEAPAIVDDYASRDYVFAAIKLVAGAGLDELHPLVIKYQGTEPCIPLKLTAIAAEEDMAVRAFFLGRRRTVPTSYRHVELNFARFDWSAFGTNYNELVSNAVDSPGASGRAFVTEYAGPSSIVDSTGLYDSRWQANTFTALRAVDVVDELERQGLMQCSSADCTASHPQVLPLLRNHLPPPAGVSEAQFWSCTSCYSSLFDETTFDGLAFAQDFTERIVEPGLHASTILDQWPYLTRLFTTISPAEMTSDPEFIELPASIGDVSQSLTATDRTTCEGVQTMDLPDGRRVVHPVGGWAVYDERMPWAERVEEFSEDGSSIVVADFNETINAELKRWNASQGWDPGIRARDDLAETHGGGGCACGFRAPPGQGFAYLGILALAVFRRFTSHGRRGRPSAA